MGAGPGIRECEKCACWCKESICPGSHIDGWASANAAGGFNASIGALSDEGGKDGGADVWRVEGDCKESGCQSQLGSR